MIHYLDPPTQSTHSICGKRGKRVSDPELVTCQVCLELMASRVEQALEEDDPPFGHLPTATGSDLDNLGAIAGVQRHPAVQNHKVVIDVAGKPHMQALGRESEETDVQLRSRIRCIIARQR